MITFDITKPKTLTFTTMATGIDPAQLDSTFRVTVEGIEYGFPGEKVMDKVVVKIPALTEVIKGIKPGKYTAKMEVTGQDKYYLCTFNESVNIIAVPKVTMKMEKELKNEEVIAPNNSEVTMNIIEETDGPESVIAPNPAKKSKFAMGLIDKLNA